jgi:hypothetical protein
MLRSQSLSFDMLLASGRVRAPPGTDQPTSAPLSPSTASELYNDFYTKHDEEAVRALLYAEVADDQQIASALPPSFPPAGPASSSSTFLSLPFPSSAPLGTSLRPLSFPPPPQPSSSAPRTTTKPTCAAPGCTKVQISSHCGPPIYCKRCCDRRGGCPYHNKAAGGANVPRTTPATSAASFFPGYVDIIHPPPLIPLDPAPSPSVVQEPPPPRLFKRTMPPAMKDQWASLASQRDARRAAEDKKKQQQTLLRNQVEVWIWKEVILLLSYTSAH